MFVGTKTLIKLIVRRDRVKLPVWIMSISLTLPLMVPMLQKVYGDSASLVALHRSFGVNPAGLFLTGPMDAPTFGALMTIETVLWWGLAVAFMNTLFVIRHTRHNEEIGAQELLLSTRMHRLTSLVSTLVVACIANAMIALFTALGLMAMGGIDGGDVWLFGASLGIFGCAWAAIAAVVAQLVQSSRSANGILAGLIGLAFLLRGIGDSMGKVSGDGILQAAWPSWLSPFGWLQASRALTFPEWQPLMFMVACIAVMTQVAFWLLSVRDEGAGILPSRAGRPRASRFLCTPLGLTLKLQKNIFLGWFVGVVAMAVTIGVMAPSVNDVYGSSESMRQLLVAMGGKGTMIATFLGAMLAMTILMVCAYGLQAMGKMRSEETMGHVEQLLATKLSRGKWLALHGASVLAGGTLLVVAAAFSMTMCASLVSDVSVDVGVYIGSALSYVPVIAAFVGLYVALFGIAPKLAGTISWLYFGFVAFALWIAPMLHLSQWVENVALLSHFPAAPVESIAWRSIIITSVGALGGMILGFFAFARRNIE